jgi:hypothetical protein
MCEITKIPLVNFLIFSFNLTAIFNDMGYLKQNESLIYQSESFLTLGVPAKITKVQERLVNFPKKKKKKTETHCFY